MKEMQDREVAIFAGGCFWGVEHVMRKMADIESIEAGYIGGHADIGLLPTSRCVWVTLVMLRRSG